MSYTALYRKFRPYDFDEVKGQDHIVTTLKNQLKAGRIGHAYLFCGTRGTGKTSVAKIFAKAVNCENPVDGNPCNKCAMCRAIAAGNSMNVIEIDAASNNGVDNIREIVEEVQYSPTEGKYKVYIIDEVHMLSIGAFNALLKTLEEPPAYVIFILATTEAHKIPITILSRCQRYDFKRITIDVIAARLKELTDREGLDVEDRALRYVARAADGSLRDGLSLLDQCIAFYLGEKLTYDNVLEVLGAVDTEVFFRLYGLIEKGDSLGCINELDQVITMGRDLSQFITDFTWFLRNLMLVKTSADVTDMLDMSVEKQEELKKLAAGVEMETVMRYIKVMSDLANQLRYSKNKRVLTEIAFIKLTRPAMEDSYEALVDRISVLEKKIENGVVMKEAGPSQSNMKSMYRDMGSNSEQNERKAGKKAVMPAVPEDVQRAVDNWSEILRKVSYMTKNCLKSGKLSVAGDDRLLIVFSDVVTYQPVSREVAIEEIEDAILQTIGKSVKVEVKLLEAGQEFNDYFVEIKKKVNMNIEEEDF